MSSFQNILISFELFPKNNNAYPILLPCLVKCMLESSITNLTVTSQWLLRVLPRRNNQVTLPQDVHISHAVTRAVFGTILNIYNDSICLFMINLVSSRYNRNWYLNFGHCGLINDLGSSPQPWGFALGLWWSSQVVNETTMTSILVSIPIIIAGQGLHCLIELPGVQRKLVNWCTVKIRMAK